MKRLEVAYRGSAVETCADAFVKAIAEARERVCVPNAIRPVSFGRQLLGPAWRTLMKRGARTSVPLAEREVAALGRPFGQHSMGLMLTERERRQKS
jgi:hypothetical protein